ncbi:MAG: hypothetical protein ABI041_15575, partial [Bdellovibrionia bacterium]
MNLTLSFVLSALFISWILGYSAVASSACIEKELPNRGHACHYPGTGAMSNKVLYFFHGVSG